MDKATLAALQACKWQRIQYGCMEHAIPSLGPLLRYRIRQFCEFGLQTSHHAQLFLARMQYF
jgi:hypothetical protein